MNHPLELTIAKLELKQLEVIDKLSEKHDDYVIRCVIDPITSKFLEINGDWEKVTGFSERSSLGKPWTDFIVGENDLIIENTKHLIYSDSKFSKYECNIATRFGSVLVKWKTMYHPEINSIVSIGRVKK